MFQIAEILKKYNEETEKYTKKKKMRLGNKSRGLSNEKLQ